MNTSLFSAFNQQQIIYVKSFYAVACWSNKNRNLNVS